MKECLTETEATSTKIIMLAAVTSIFHSFLSESFSYARKNFKMNPDLCQSNVTCVTTFFLSSGRRADPPGPRRAAPPPVPATTALAIAATKRTDPRGWRCSRGVVV